MKKPIGITLTLMATLTASQGAVSFLASLQDNPNTFEIGRWSLTTTVKSNDIDGDNYYGTDGYFWANNNNSGSGTGNALSASTESAPSFTGGISFTGTNGNSASFNGAENRLNSAGGGPALNVGYAGQYNPSGTVALGEMFSYTMNRNMFAGETIRIGIVDDSLGDSRTGLTQLRIVAGGTADATMVANNNNGSMDMYFFDITGLSSGEEIQIWGANTRPTGNFNYASIGGVTFDSITVVPEPSSFTLMGLGFGTLLLRRRRRA